MFEDLIPKIEALGFETKRIGNSLYITRDEPFSVTTPNSILLRVLSSTEIGDDNYIIQANDISEVPLQTKHNLPFRLEIASVILMITMLSSRLITTKMEQALM